MLFAGLIKKYTYISRSCITTYQVELNWIKVNNFLLLGALIIFAFSNNLFKKLTHLTLETNRVWCWRWNCAAHEMNARNKFSSIYGKDTSNTLQILQALLHVRKFGNVCPRPHKFSKHNQSKHKLSGNSRTTYVLSVWLVESSYTAYFRCGLSVRSILKVTNANYSKYLCICYCARLCFFCRPHGADAGINY